MKLTSLGAQVMEERAGLVAHTQAAAVSALLDTLPRETAWAIDEAVGLYASKLLEAGFLAGVGVGRDPLALLIE